jgi:tyrosine-protein phosphatase SIW14
MRFLTIQYAQYPKMQYVLTLLLATGLAFAGSDTPAISNFHQVDTKLFRGAQPAPGEFQDLARLGIKTVLDLREDSHARSERKIVEAAGMRYISLPLNGRVAPSDAQIAQALAVIEDAANGPVFVHCRRGADRTGTVIACYRITHQQWNNQKALDEARSLGMSWTEFGMRNYVLHYRALTPAPVVAAAPLR